MTPGRCAERDRGGEHPNSTTSYHELPSKRNASADARLDAVSFELFANLQSLHADRRNHRDVVADAHRRVERDDRSSEPFLEDRAEAGVFSTMVAASEAISRRKMLKLTPP
jgi:hypothetical protein